MPATWEARRFAVLLGAFGLLLPLASALNLGAEQSTGAHNGQHPVDFVQEIQPIFSNNCYECHGPQKQKGGLRLDQKTAALQGGDSGSLLVFGQSRESLLIQAVEGTNADLAQMPKKRDPLSAEQIALLRSWIDQGAHWPETASVAAAKDWRRHWAFKAPVRPRLPQVRNRGWVRNPIDSFVLARLEGEHLQPAAEADRVTLLRRLSLDLIGLPPTMKKLMRSWPITAPMLTRRRSNACSLRLIMANAGHANGWTRPAMPTRMVLKRTSRAVSGFIAIGSSTPLTGTCLTTNL